MFFRKFCFFEEKCFWKWRIRDWNLNLRLKENIKKAIRGDMRTGWWGEYLDLGGRKKQEAVEKFHDHELHNLYSSPNIIMMIKLKRIWWVVDVTRTADKWNTYKVLVGKRDGKTSGWNLKEQGVKSGILKQILNKYVEWSDWIRTGTSGKASEHYSITVTTLVMSPAGFGTKNGCAGDDQQLSTRHPDSECCVRTPAHLRLAVTWRTIIRKLVTTTVPLGFNCRSYQRRPPRNSD
jgi:hypothetical protein